MSSQRIWKEELTEFEDKQVPPTFLPGQALGLTPPRINTREAKRMKDGFQYLFCPWISWLDEEEPKTEQKGPRKHINQRQQILSTKALLGLTLIYLFLEMIIMFREKNASIF